MIAELLRPDRIVLGLRGEAPQVLEELFRDSFHPDLAREFQSGIRAGNADRYSYIGQNIAIPHVRLEGLAAPEMILGLSREGIRLNEHIVKILLFFATPADQTEEHLQLLQRLSSLLPTIRDELLTQRRREEVVKVIIRGERLAGKATYFHLTQGAGGFWV